ncbi:PmoA family protein [Microbacterium amylolyticum]|uniref:Oxidoreductase n=1 Tax=Microbacterium amylolyticum TaxID=936337 RepID=A0ABS4ZJA0_9MICO|nr:PmoA family protein [Microbacterium amylolyticum]MBP2437025.1 hypothetical protein [Microbacterium amylolyticum]
MAEITIAREDEALTVTAGGTDIARYVFRDNADAFEGPKPFLHPLRTLSGAPITGYRPWDHRWHKGLQMTLTDVSGQNFWGGNTYVHGEGYLPLDNIGQIRHDEFTAVASGVEAHCDERLTWITRAGQEWLSEERQHRFHSVDRAGGTWALDMTSALVNVGGHELVLGSPTTLGRENAGYSGAFLRLTRSFAGGVVTTPDGEYRGAEADAVMGTQAPWLAFSGAHDEIDGGATVLAFAGTSTGQPPLRWFVRSEPFPVIAPSPTFSETIVLSPGDRLELSHRFVITDRIHSAPEIAALAARLTP